MRTVYRLCLSALICVYSTSAFCQNDHPLKNIMSAVDSVRKRLPIEKLYLQTDKPYYTVSDTLHFKGYVLDADYLTPSARSGLLYVDLLDKTNTAVKRMMFPVVMGLSWGDVALNEDDVPEGSYKLKAYTNWMLNFGEDYIFNKDIYISPANNEATLINAGFKLDKQTGQDKIFANLQFISVDKQPQRLRDLQLKVKDGRRTLYKDKTTTDLDGIINVNFNLPAKTNVKNLAIEAQDLKPTEKTATLIVPVTINRTENTDVQFMPEGGALVAGIPARLGFKALSENGKATAINGRVVNSKQQQVATFSTLHAGMGSFDFSPQSGETYTASVTLPGNISKTYPLPPLSSQGTVLRVDTHGTDSLLVSASNTEAGAIYLFGQARGVVCYAGILHFTGKSTVKQLIATKLFPTGIVRFSLLNANRQPLNERVVYINHQDNLNINISADKTAYKTRDSVAMQIEVKDNTGKPVQGSFSLAVTDDTQVRPDSLGSSVVNNFLLTSDLKGTVEDPGYYLQDSSSQVTAALDNLLLTQGWVGYDWKQLFDPKSAPIKRAPEMEFVVKGRVTNIFNRPVEKSQVVLMSTKPVIIRDTVTNTNGEFIFKNLFLADTAVFKVQARNKRGKSFNVGLTVDEMAPPEYAISNKQQMPWYVNSDTILLDNAHTKIVQLKAESAYRGEGHVLKEVVIKAQKIIKDSKNLNGPGEADQALDEKDLQKLGKMTLGEVLEKKIKGFKTNGIWSRCGMCRSVITSYLINDKLIHLVFDGMNANKFFDGSEVGPTVDPERARYLKSNFLDYFLAEDIKGIEVMYSASYTGLYGNSHELSKLNIAYIEITTRGGKGPFTGFTPGTYLYKPLAFTLPKQFYRPRYTDKNSKVAVGTDLRSTIHWAPNIITDSTGKARISFYCADKAAPYTIIVQGTDLLGQVGYKRKRIVVK
jgi:hypothetical protein